MSWIISAVINYVSSGLFTGYLDDWYGSADRIPQHSDETWNEMWLAVLKDSSVSISEGGLLTIAQLTESDFHYLHLGSGLESGGSVRDMLSAT